jgi:ribosomal protection tetracycline resistance protein
LIEVLAEQDDSIMTAYLENEAAVPYRRLRHELAAHTRAVAVHPVFFGSAITGAGVEPLMAAIAELLPAVEGNADGPVSGTVFKIERASGGEKIAYVRMFSGTVRARDRVRFGLNGEGKVTAVDVFADGSSGRRGSVSAGQIGKLWGLPEIQVGDAIGMPRRDGEHPQFAPPTLETVVVPAVRRNKGALLAALAQLAEQDPLINVRQDDALNEMSVSLYGEVQKEVIQATLANDFGIDVTFRETTTIYIERPAGTGDAVEVLRGETNPFAATVGLRVEPAPIGSGLEFRVAVDPRELPIHIYKTVQSFAASMTQYIGRTLQEGLHGWQVTDCLVTMNACGYFASDGARVGDTTPRTTAADFRKLTPLVLMLALAEAGTLVCEPMIRVHIETPSPTLAAVLASVARLGGVVEATSMRGDLATIATTVPAASAQDLQRRLPGLSGGEGVAETNFAGYRPVSSAPPTRRRTMANPLNREEYMRHAEGRG